MRVLIRFDCVGVIGMNMIFTSSRLYDSLIYRADHFLRMPFLLQNFTAVSLRSLLRGRGKVISHLARYSIFKVAVKRSFTYSHWERLNKHPESQKFFIPSLIWNWEVKTQPVFWKKILKRLHVSKNLLTCSHWESVFGDGNSEKRQKNKLAGYGRHTFDTKNIINFLKYSERIDIGWIIRKKML